MKMIKIAGWILRIIMFYIFISALLNYAYFVGIMMMYAILYLEFFEDTICRIMKRNIGDTYK